MREYAPQPGVRVNWAKLNNELFALLYADLELRMRYERATAAQATEMCSELFDKLAADPAEFVERYLVLEGG